MPKNSQKGVIGLVGILLIGVALVSVTISVARIAPQIKETILPRLGLTPTPKPSPSGKVTPTTTPSSAPASSAPSPTPQPSYRDPGGKSYCGGKFNSCCSSCISDADCTPGAFCQSFATGDECGYSAECVWPASPTPRSSVSPAPTPTPQPSSASSSSTTTGASGGYTARCYRAGSESCCSYCGGDQDCPSGQYCKRDGCDTYCDLKPSPSPSPTPRSSVSPAPTPTPQISPSSSPNPTSSPVPFEPYCSAIGEWKSNQTCCYDCRKDSDCAKGTCRYDEVCGSYCLSPSTASPSPTPEASPTSQAKKSQELLPGNFLYPLKNISRGMRVLFTFDQSRKAQLYLDFANEKIDEVYILADKNRLSDAALQLKSYTNDLGKATKITTQLTDSKSKEELSKKILVDGFNHQALLRLIEEAAPSDKQKEIQEARVNTITYLTQTTQGVGADGLKDAVATLVTKKQSPLKTLGYAQTLDEIKPHVSEELGKAINDTQILVRAKLKTTISNLKKEQKELYLDELKTVTNDPKTLELIENAEEGKIVAPENGNIPQFNTPEEYIEWFKKFYNFEDNPPDESDTQPTFEENSPEPEEQ